ncbi:MAG: hypothetical protein OCD76_11840 [Reichenbachiella sp.]
MMRQNLYGKMRGQFLLTLGMILSSIGWIGCSALQQDEKSNVYEVLKSQEIRQLTSADVMLASQKFGESVFGLLDSTNSMCDIVMLDSLGKSFDGKLSLGSGAKDFALKQEKDLFDAYQYNITNNVESKNSIQRLDDKMAVYTIPFYGKEYCQPNDSIFYMLSIVFPTKVAINRLD